MRNYFNFLMLKKQPKSIYELAGLLRKEHRKRGLKLQKARQSPFAIDLALRVMRRHDAILARDPSYLSRYPNFNTILLRAADKQTPLSRQIAKRENSRKPRKNKTVRAGPSIPGLRPPLILKKLLPRNLDVVLEQFIFDRSKPCKILWNELRPFLETFGTHIKMFQSNRNIRDNKYRFHADGKSFFVTYREFETIFTRARKRLRLLNNEDFT